MDFIQLETFYYVSKLKSFTLAGDVLNVSQPTISRRIALLESGLQVTLLNRKNTGQLLSLTNEGEVLSKFSKTVILQTRAITKKLSHSNLLPEGDLRISTGPSLAASWLTRFLPGFLGIYPDIRLRIEGNLSTHKDFDYDVYIQPKIENTTDLIQIKLDVFKTGLYASADYLQRFGLPQAISDLDSHRVISFGDIPTNLYDSVNWILRIGKEPGTLRTPFMTLNSSEGLLKVAKDGLGIVELAKGHPEHENSGLINILSDIEGPSTEIYFSYHKSLEGSKKIEALRDFLIEEISTREKESI